MFALSAVIRELVEPPADWQYGSKTWTWGARFIENEETTWRPGGLTVRFRNPGLPPVPVLAAVAAQHPEPAMQVIVYDLLSGWAVVGGKPAGVAALALWRTYLPGDEFVLPDEELAAVLRAADRPPGGPHATLPDGWSRCGPTWHRAGNPVAWTDPAVRN